MKFDQKSTEKARKATVATKIDNGVFLGALFFAKSRLLVVFEALGGIQKLLKIYDPFTVKASWKPSGSHFG